MNISKKIVVVGHFGVGKSSLIRRFVQNAFSEEYKVTIGVQIHKKEILVKAKKITFVVWDIEGKEDLDKIRKSYLLGTSGFIYVIDPTRDSTYINLKSEIEYIKINYPTASIIKVASKSDLIEIDNFVNKIALNELEIDVFSSSKTGENVNKIFETLGLNFV